MDAAKSPASPIHRAQRPSDVNPSTAKAPTQSTFRTQPNVPADHVESDSQATPVGGDESLNGTDHTTADALRTHIGAAKPASHSQSETQRPPACSAYAGLLLAADFLNDVEQLRMATANRLRVLTEGQIGEGGEVIRPPIMDTATEQRWRTHLEAVEALENSAVLELKRALRRHPLGAWVRDTIGVGEKQGARLLAAIGDPYWNDADDRARRGPAELWAYCGYAPEQRRQRGVKSNWNADAKMRAFLIAESCVKQTGTVGASQDPNSTAAARQPSPYRAVYDDARAHYAEAVHDKPCVRCGPSGKPALEGSSLSAGHQHARALRKVAKALLKDLYLAARGVQVVRDTHDADDVRAA